jgi:hypothetical protein
MEGAEVEVLTIADKGVGAPHPLRFLVTRGTDIVSGEQGLILISRSNFYPIRKVI